MNRLRELYSRYIKKSCQIERKRKESLVFGRQVGSQMEPDRARPAIITTIDSPAERAGRFSWLKATTREADRNKTENDPV